MTFTSPLFFSRSLHKLMRLATNASLMSPVDCNTMSFADLYHDADVTQCRKRTEFDVTNPMALQADQVCQEEACRSVYRNLRGLGIATECRNTLDVYLFRDVLVPLSQSSQCSDGQPITIPDLKVYDFDDDDDDDKPVSTSSSLLTVLLVVGVVCTLIAIVVFVWVRRRRMQVNHHKSSKSDTSQRKTDSLTDSTDTYPLSATHGYSIWEDEDLLQHKMRAEDLEDIRVLGTGASGVVYLVRLNGDRLLASKRLAPNHMTRIKLLAFVQEIKLVATLDHPSIVAFVGVAWTKQSDVQALFEFMPNGDLCTYLTNTRKDDLSELWDRTKLQMAIEIVEALVYVHSFTPPLVHRDLKSRNVLLGEHLEAKLSDFGVSRYQSSSRTMTMGVGTGRWLAPEVISGDGAYNERCDIYSFGIVLAEMDSHRLPFSDLHNASGNELPQMAILQQVSGGTLKPTFRETCPERLKELALRCLSCDPNDRPPAVEIAYTLRTIVKDF